MKNLTSAQRDELIEQYVELVVDSMDHKSLEQYVYEQMVTYVESLSDSEIKEEINNHDEELFDELVDNITSEEKCQTWEELKEANS
jgi:vacuolar-type H+-ATPase subunit E/Vma4